MNFGDFYGGTTIMAVEFDGGVVIGADTRTSCRTYVSNRAANKLTRITDNIYCCRSGSASHTQTLADSVAYAMNVYEIGMGEPPLVYDAALDFRNKIYAARDFLMASIIVAGWDRHKGGQVYSVPISGLLVHEPCAVAGSGSAYILGYVTANYKPGMNCDETVELVKNTVQLAMQHDCSSGGIVRIGVITEKGIETSTFFYKDPKIVQFANTALWNLEFGGGDDAHMKS